MNNLDFIEKETSFLFNCNFSDPSFDDENTVHADAAEALITENGWSKVFPIWFEYLQNNCMSDDDVLNFANLFFYYGGANKPLRDPYPFISYFYYRIDTSKYGGKATDILDSIVISLLSNIGDVSLENNPEYVPEKDPRILSAIEKWRRTNKLN